MTADEPIGRKASQQYADGEAFQAVSEKYLTHSIS
jgi:hypothetical protein